MSSAFVTLLACIGLYISVYFTLLTYNIVPTSARFVPAVCRLDGASCTTIVHTPSAKLIAGIPNALLGIVYYVAVLMATATGILWHKPVLLFYTLLGAATVLLGVYLVYQLYAVMRVACVLCITSHTINALLFITFAAAAVVGP